MEEKIWEGFCMLLLNLLLVNKSSSIDKFLIYILPKGIGSPPCDNLILSTYF